jgi:3-isopropylmalate/(R)-2-methylmalate dehydratase large subunit
MSQTIVEKIFSDHSGKKVFAGEIVKCKVDMTIGNDITTPISIRAFEQNGANSLANPDGFALVMDHFIPAKDIASANQARISRDFATKHNLKHFFDEKDMGIEHALLPEKGLVSPGDVVIGADSHTCTHGALGAFATGIGSTDLAFTMITGTNWFKVPSSIKVHITGKMDTYVGGKDIILEIIRILGVDGALYKALEFSGDLGQLTMDDRFALCNMAIEAGAKCGIVPVDDVTKAFINDNEKLAREPKYFYGDDNAKYEKIINIDLNKLEPVIAYPFLPSNGHSITQAVKDNIKVDQVFIGSCTNGRISDLRIAAKILKNKKVAKHTRMIITPATQKIWKQATKEGLSDIFIDAGAVISNPTCGACLGGYMGILGTNEVCISTTNRNFVGRMGDRSSKIYLSNSAIAAYSAISGYISNPKDS